MKKVNYLKMLFFICLAHYTVGYCLAAMCTNYLGWIGVIVFIASLIFYIVVMYKYLVKIYNRLK